ncbi:hypothetical protein PFLUV_G00189530 [Perca fluviatilis]|uniref:Uncharacterized protein n=1 Tax=Perca fluviatilis TaxID=8168 RepID=A0A6A5DVC2_PERFL|nr:hypothetical protein PFLUV_G00189530 [Perca fluviatilis]
MQAWQFAEGNRRESEGESGELECISELGEKPGSDSVRPHSVGGRPVEPGTTASTAGWFSNSPCFVCLPTVPAAATLQLLHF